MVTRNEIIERLSLTAPEAVEALRREAYAVMSRTVGEMVYYRGIIELSNVCTQDCTYCGIRVGNPNVSRYTLPFEQAMEAASWCAAEGYGSIVIQSGERRSRGFLDEVTALVREIKQRTVSDRLPEGLGITLSLGELSLDDYRRLREAGAHRYLLRIETSSKALFEALHPAGQSFEERLAALDRLRCAGFQVGTGVMIGLPGQSVEMLADDVLLFRELDVDMVGMGPFIPHRDTPLSRERLGDALLPDERRLQLALNMIAVTRLVCPDINIASTTALQAMVPNGRELGLTYGANVTMPNLTPTSVRKDYTLYDGKPCLEESKTECKSCLVRRVASTGRQVGFDAWGDAPHALNRRRP